MRATSLSFWLLPFVALAGCDRGSKGAGSASTSGSGRDATLTASAGQAVSAPEQQAGASGTIPTTPAPAVALPSFADLADRLEPADEGNATAGAGVVGKI